MTKHAMLVALVLMLSFSSLASADRLPFDASSASHPYGFTSFAHYGPSMNYLPAPPGKRPACAGSSETFCTRVDYYPTELIEYLVKRYNYDFKTLLQNESVDALAAPSSVRQRSPTFDRSPSFHSTGGVYVPSSAPIVQAPANHSTAPFASLRSTQNSAHYASSNDDWWSRYARPAGHRRQQSVSTSIRVARQVNDNSNALCPTISQFITPRAAVNTKGNWMYLVNVETATQLVRSERCATSECSGLCQVPIGFKSSCSQQYVQKRLIALNSNGDSLYTDVFWFPHCCTCQIKSAIMD